MPVRQGTRLRLGRPIGGVQTGWQTSSGRLAAADSGWFGCETAGVAAKRRVRPTGGCDDSGAGRSIFLCCAPTNDDELLGVRVYHDPSTDNGMLCGPGMQYYTQK